jgi:hypothetical protein
MAIGGAADIALQEFSLPTSDFSGGCKAFCLVDVEDGDEGSHFAEAMRDAASDAGGGAGNHGDLAFER